VDDLRSVAHLEPEHERLLRGVRLGDPLMLPSAGPTARLTFTLTLLAATAIGSSAFGTRRDTTAPQAGAVSASPIATREAKANRFQAVTQ
jgi:hypothetical protein